MLDLFHAGDSAAAAAGRRPGRTEGVVARHRAGAIGARAMAYGVIHEADDPGAQLAWPQPARELKILQNLPDAIDPSWDASTTQRVVELSLQVAAIGAVAQANLWRSNLARPRSKYFDLDGLDRMAEVVIRQFEGATGMLKPVAPALQFDDLADVTAIMTTASAAPNTLPRVIASAVVDRLNAIARTIAEAGHASPYEVHAGNAPGEVLKLKQQFQRITGATARLINQVGHLARISRAGQTAHAPMTFARRVMLVDSAMAQLAEDLGVEAWRADEVGILTEDIRRAWAQREVDNPAPPPFARNLFEWAELSRPCPSDLADETLASLIQGHHDLAFVDLLRAERRRRDELASAAHAHPDRLATSRQPRSTTTRKDTE